MINFLKQLLTNMGISKQSCKCNGMTMKLKGNLLEGERSLSKRDA